MRLLLKDYMTFRDSLDADHISVHCEQGDRKEMVIRLRRPYSNGDMTKKNMHHSWADMLRV